MVAGTLGVSGMYTPPSVLITTIGRLLSVNCWQRLRTLYALNRVRIRMIFFIKNLSEPKVIIRRLHFSALRNDFDKQIHRTTVDSDNFATRGGCLFPVVFIN